MAFFSGRENFLLQNNIFRGNMVLGGGGGAIYLFNSLPLVIEKCIFTNNNATSAPTVRNKRIHFLLSYRHQRRFEKECVKHSLYMCVYFV